MEWLSLYSGGTGQIEEKKSRFIATIEPVSSEEEACDLIASVKKRYWDARHNCSAFIIGDKGQMSRCSDDGEPSGTAGRPMLDTLINEHITNVCVVVTRYFGGTLLGTGGLVRAYSRAVKEGLANCTVIKKTVGSRVSFKCDYNDIGKIQYTAAQKGYHIMDCDYGSEVTVSMISDEGAKLVEDIRDITSGRASIGEPESVTYAIIDGKPVLFED